jgi:hypothetical protein
MDHAAILRAIDVARCLAHQAYGVDSQSAAAGIAFYRAVLADWRLIDEAKKGKDDSSQGD